MTTKDPQAPDGTPVKAGVVRLVARKEEDTDSGPGSVLDIVNKLKKHAPTIDTIFVVFRQKDGEWATAWSTTTNGDLVYAHKVMGVAVDTEVLGGIIHVPQEPK